MSLDQIMFMVPILLITSLVQFLKEVGMPSKYAKIAAFCLAVMFGIIVTLNSDLAQTVVTILQYALGAVGLWEIAGSAYQKLSNPSQPPAVDPEKIDNSTTNPS